MSLTALTVSCPSTALATTSSFQERRWARRILSTSLRTAIRHGRSSSLRGGRCFFTKLHFLDFLSFFADDSKKRLRRLSWGRTRIFLVGFFPFARRLIFTFNVLTSNFKPGSEIKFPLLFTEELDFDLYPYLLVGDDGLGTVTTSWKNDPMWFLLLQNWRLDVCLWCLE